MKRIVMAVALFAACGVVPMGTLSNVAHAAKSAHDEAATVKRNEQRAKDAALKEKRASEKAAKAAKKK